ncbi:MAG: DUF3467 domain-containing protein [Pyrinomonadaceae bacterium]
MTTRKKPVKPVQKQNAPRINFEKGDDHQIVYSNVIQVLHTPVDFQITFGLVDASIKRPENRAAVKAVASVMLSPIHARQLAELLMKNVAKYEDDYMKLDLKSKKAPEEEGGQYIDLDLSEQPNH